MANPEEEARKEIAKGRREKGGVKPFSKEANDPKKIKKDAKNAARRKK